jgi:hypothetical protein
MTLTKNGSKESMQELYDEADRLANDIKRLQLESKPA